VFLAYYEYSLRLCLFTEYDTVIVRFGGEIGIKSEWTRRQYERLLRTNIYNVLRYHNIAYEKIQRKRGRIYVKTKNALAIAQALTKVFGISSVSPSVRTTSNLDSIQKTVLQLVGETISKDSSFAVRCRRVGEHPYTSMEICKTLGNQILTVFKERNLHVDLTNPQYTLNVEVREDEAYIFTEALQGAGGFPAGSQPKAVCLLSGGIDSPVACWLAMKRGCTIVPLYLDNAPLTDEAATEKALATARKLFEWLIGYPTKVYIVPHGKNLQTFMEKAPRKLTCLLCKRMMYRIAERIADLEKVEGIVTGEAIGEQASQTLTNLRVLNEVAKDYPIHRPLLGFDKTETETIARKIGTFEISIRKAQGCTAAPNKPATQARLSIIKEAEKELEIEEMVKESLKGLKVVTL